MRLGQLRKRLQRLEERQHWGPGGIRVTLVSRDTLPAVKEDISELYRWLWLLDGEATCYDEQQQAYALGAGDCFIRAPDQRHRVERPLHQAHYFEVALIIPRQHWHSMTDNEIINPQQRFIPLADQEHCISAFWRWFQSLKRNDQTKSTIHSINLLNELLGLIHPQGQQLQQRDMQLLHALQNALTATQNWSIPLEHIANDHDISMDRMRGLFRQALGCLPKEYQMRRRCERAANLLLNPQLSIADVAERLHYPDPFAFSKQFSKVMGLSPRQYRKQQG